MSFFGNLLLVVYKSICSYIKHSYQNDPFRVLLEGFLLLFALWYIGTRAYRPNSEAFKLTSKVLYYGF